MRRRVVRVAVVAVAVALTLLAVPLAVGIRVSFFDDERSELTQAALSAAVRVGPRFASGDPVELPAATGDRRIGIYDRSMRRRAGLGPPSADPVSQRAASGVVARGRVGDELVVAVPISSAERVIGVVRAASPVAVAWRHVTVAWLALIAAVLLVLAVAVAIARRQARGLSAPLESLSDTAQAVADGDLNARASSSGIAEIDRVASTQNLMLERLTDALERERHFSANASHQLRTPVTGLQLGLEAALAGSDARLRAALDEALTGTHQLRETIDEVLALSRLALDASMTASPQDLSRLLDGAQLRWHGFFADDGRRLTILGSPDLARLPIPGRATSQVLDVLLDNARVHGSGSVEVTVRELGEAVAIDVVDEGTVRLGPDDIFERGRSTGTGPGIGLALARSMAQGVGGRVVLSGTAPTKFTLLLPSQDSPRAGQR